MDENKIFLDKIKQMTGKDEEAIKKILDESGLSKHSDVRKLFIEKLELSYGFANTLVHIITKTDSVSQSEGKSTDLILNEIYTGKKEVFRPIHDLIMDRISKFGAFEIAPKKGYLSLKCKKQFAIIGPKTNTRMEIGINGKDIVGDERLIAQTKGSMCHYIIKISNISDVDDELIDWIYQAYKQSK